LLIGTLSHWISQVPYAFSALFPVKIINLEFEFIQNGYFINFVSGIVSGILRKSKGEFQTSYSFYYFKKNKKNKNHIFYKKLYAVQKL